MRGYIEFFDPPKDCNCQFSALCFFLRSIGIERSPETLRREILKYLRENPNDLEGFPLELFAGCLEHFQCSNNCSFFPRCGVQPVTGAGVAHFNLGHFAEGQGEHYLCLEVEENDDENCPNEIQENQEVCNEEENETDKAGENNDHRENKTNGKTNREDQTATEEACDGTYENQNDNNNQQSRSRELFI